MLKELEGNIPKEEVITIVEELKNSILNDPNLIVHNPYSLNGLRKAEILDLYGTIAKVIEWSDNPLKGEAIEITFKTHTITCYLDKNGVCIEGNLCTNLLDAEEMALRGYDFERLKIVH